MVDSERSNAGRPEGFIRRGRRWWRTELHGISARHRRVAPGAHWRGSQPGGFSGCQVGDYAAGEGGAAQPGADRSGPDEAVDARQRELPKSAVVGWRQGIAGEWDRG